MKPIFTDKMNVLPWVWSLLGLGFLWRSYTDWQAELFVHTWFDASAGILFLALAIVRVFDRRKPIREDRDPAIVSVKDRTT
jgi:hypothetical protein